MAAVRILWSSIRVPMRAVFHYDPGDPLMVSAQLLPPQGPAVTWVVSRDLLYEGTQGRSGMGDAQLLGTFDLVPPGAEPDSTNWDLLVERPLGDA